MNKTNLIFATAVLATLGGLSGCGTGQASVADQDEIRDATPVPVEVAQPSRADLSATYAATATITSSATLRAVSWWSDQSSPTVPPVRSPAMLVLRM